MALHRKAKGHKKLREAKNELAPPRNDGSSAPPLASPFSQGLPTPVPETSGEAEVVTQVPVPTVASSSVSEAVATAVDVVPNQVLPGTYTSETTADSNGMLEHIAELGLVDYGDPSTRGGGGNLPLSLNLGNDNSGSVDSENSDKSSHGMVRKSTTNKSPHTFWEHTVHESQLFLTKKKDGSMRTVFNLKKLNQFVLYEHFKMEGIAAVVDMLQPGDWMIRINLKDAYFAVSPTVWLRLRPKSVHETAETSVSNTAQSRSSLCNPSGRSDCPQSKPNTVNSTEVNRFVAVSKARISNQLGEIITDSTADIGVSGVYHKLSENDPSPSCGQIEENSGILPGTDSISRVTTVRKLAKVVGKLTAEEQGSTTGQIKLRNSDHTRRGMCRGTEMVDRVNHPVERQINDQTKPRLGADYHYRCLQEWLGGPVCGCGNSRVMDRNRETAAHKRSRDESSDVRNEGIYQGQEKLSCSDQNGQHKGTSLCKQNGGTKSPDLIQTTKDLRNYCMSREIMITAEHLPGSQNQIADYQSREYRDSSNWKLRRSVFLQLEKQLGPWQVDLFADRVNVQKTQYYSWKPDPGAVKTDTLTVKWQKIQGYVFPPFCLIGRCLAKIRQEQATLVLVTPMWQTQPWYVELLQMLKEEPILIPYMEGILTSPRGEQHPLLQASRMNLAAWKVSGLVQMQAKFQNRLETFSTKTSGTAQNPLTRPRRKWVSWCSGKQINPVQAPVEHIVNFLTEKFHEPLQFSTLNVCRSALSAHHPEIDDFRWGSTH